MADIDIKQKALDVLVIINTAIKNVRLYPPTSATITNAIERLHLAFLDMFEYEAPIIFAESEKSVLICGKLLEQKDQERLQVTALLNILLNFGIKSISFDKGLEKEELSAFMELLSKKPEIVKNEGGLPKIMAEKNVLHIYMDQKVYVAMDKDQKIISSLDVTDDQIAKFFMSAHPELAADPQKLQEMMKDPEWLSQTFQAGLSQMMEQKGVLSNVELSENLEKMIALMDKVTGSHEQKDRDNISQNIGKTIATMDNDIIQQLRSQDIEQLFGGMLLQYIVSAMDEVKPEDKSVESNTLNAVISAENRSSAGAAGQEKTDNQGPGSGSAAGSEKTDYQKHLFNLKEKLSLRLKDNKRPFMDAPLLFVLPKIIEQLVAQKEQETMEKIIIRLVADLLNQNADIRAQASKGLTEVIESFSPDRQNELIERLSGQLIEWIKLETVVTPAYKKICKILNDLICNFIRQGRFAESIPILDVFNDIHAGILEKNDAVHDISLEIIRKLASEEYLTILFKELNANEKNKQDEAGQILIRFGDVILRRLLDIVRDVVDSDERVRIIRLIIGMGQRAIPGVRDRINKNASWYYLRNLAYILGHIGNESSACALHPLLLHENERVRLEALKSIYQIGGKQRGPLLLAVLPLADDQFKLNIIETLGNAKCAGAVPNLLNLLKKLPLIASQLQIDLQEKICTALGFIGSPEAMPALSKIAKPNSFFRLRSYPVKIKNAAGRALISIRKKQEEAAKAAEAVDEVNVSN